MVVDDSEFYTHMPKGTIITQARPAGGGPAAQQQQQQPGAVPPGAWLFKNSGLVMRSAAYLHARADIPEAGAYHLFVRAHGEPGASFRVTVGDKQTTERFGEGPLGWERGGSFELKKGLTDVVLSGVRLGREVGATFDVLVLTKDADFKEEDLKPLELHEDVALVKEYAIPRSSSVKFGDVDGDGRTDIFVVTGNYDGRVYDHEGRELWSYENEQAFARGRASFEAPGLVWDFDRDGAAEVAHYRLEGGREWLVVSEGKTGAVRHKTAWPAPAPPHEYNNFRLAVADFGGGHPDTLLAFTDSGGTISITAFTKELRQLWQHVERRKKDHLGHYAYPVDLDGDGVDEVVASPLVLDARGRVRWHRFDLFDDNHDHCDSFRFYDLDGDGRVELLAPVSEVGVVAFRATDGALVWRHPAEHSQQLEVGRFLRAPAGPHVAVNARTYARNGEAGIAGQVHWLDARGNLLSKWPANPLNGNPDFVKGDWRGDGREHLFWYRFKLGDDGRGTLYFKQDAYHMFDFLGTGAEQVIARGANVLQVYASPRARTRANFKRDAAYWKRVANHTHY